MRKLTLTAFFAAVTFVSGCAYENQARRAEEHAINSPRVDLNARSADGTTSTREELLSMPSVRVGIYAWRLSAAYQALGDRAATSRDQITTGMIALGAGVAASEAITIGTAQVSRLVAGGAVLNQAAKYVHPKGSAEAFYTAADQAACISSGVLKFYGGQQTAVDMYANSVAMFYLKRAELGLRNALSRDIPTFTSVVSDLTGVIDENTPQPLVSGSERTASVGDEMKTVLAACFSKTETPKAKTTETQTQNPNPGNGAGGSAGEGGLPDVVVENG